MRVKQHFIMAFRYGQNLQNAFIQYYTRTNKVKLFHLISKQQKINRTVQKSIEPHTYKSNLHMYQSNRTNKSNLHKYQSNRTNINPTAYIQIERTVQNI